MITQRLISILSALVVGILALSGCAQRYVNKPLTERAPDGGYRYKQESIATNSDKLLVILTFSGGGTRAAALSYGVLKELARAEIVIDGTKRRLLDEVDLISSVSGGSFTSAYFALFGDRIFEDFEEKFLKRNIQGKLAGMMISPWVWPRLWSINYNRDDMAADLYHEEIFEQKTFGDLMARNQPPFIIVNATDVALGARFEFTQNQFDLIESDLADFPVARAVAASSAVPGLFGTVNLKNHADREGEHVPEWVDEVLADPESSLRLRTTPLDAQSYADAKERPRVHLADGGISDNLGVRGPLDMMIKQSVAQDRALIELSEEMEKVLLVVVDAHVDKSRGYNYEKSLGLLSLIGLSVSIPMQRASFESLELFEETFERRALEIDETRSQKAEAMPEEEHRPLTIYPAYLQFNSLPNPEDVEFFQTMPTSFKLKPEAVDRLSQLAADQLANSVHYQKLLQDLDATVKDR